jgi:SAM-dependent methyltransferase|tara:strand:- start:3633 stop:4487 length:855 start_codon:yes stop_codon:yes gene_type:complete
MAPETSGPSGGKSSQRSDWDNVSGGWRKWWPIIEKGAKPVSERLLDMAGVTAGQAVLDIATGIGEPAVSAAGRVGAEGRVAATDLSPKMLEIARERASELGLDNISFHEMDGENVGSIDDTFDAVLCRWGLMFMPDPEAALRNVRARMRSGGAIAAAVWGPPPEVPFLSLPIAVLKEALDLPPPGAPGLFSLADAGRLKELFQAAGFTSIGIETIEVVFSLPSVDDYISFLQDIASPIIALLADQPPKRRAELWREIGEAARGHADASGGLSMPNLSLCVMATA